ncbi:MAG: FAD-binding oxidoreductase [Proteobacteria bacterium]|nr:FAD-binding oxidoreductase [Pseudomonadota bacterium]
MTQRYDVAIAGGAVMGSAVAYFLAADADFDGSIAVVERDPGYEACATTRSWGGIRQQFSTPENVKMSLYGAQFVRRAGELLEVDGERPDLGFKERGYLFLASPAGLPVLERNCAMQRELGAAVAVLEPAELAERFPWLNLDGLAGAGCGLANEGWFDPSALLHGFRRKARALGVTYVKDEVVSVEVSRGRVTGLGLRAGGRLDCGTLVNAAGPQAGALAALAGAALPVGPRKRMTYVFDCRAALPPLPLVIDVSGVAFRPEGAQYIAIVSPPLAEDFERDDFELEYGAFEEVIWPTLAQRVPAFEAIKLTGAWAGHYDYNAFDQNAILGPHPEIEGLMFCNGFSGHGVQQSPAAGRAVAELIVHGRFRSLDLTKLLYARIAEGRPVQEENVV